MGSLLVSPGSPKQVGPRWDPNTGASYGLGHLSSLPSSAGQTGRSPVQEQELRVLLTLDMALLP